MKKMLVVAWQLFVFRGVLFQRLFSVLQFFSA